MEITAQEILNSMFNADESVCLRVFDDRKDSSFPGAKLTIECGKFGTMVDTLRNHNIMYRGIFYVVNYGGHKDEEITRINAQFVEMDSGSFTEQQAKIDAFPLKPSIIIRTRKSLHTYWLVKNADVSQFRNVQGQLVQYFGGDPMCVNESRVMRLPGFNHCKKEPVLVECIYFHPELRYTQQELSEAMPPLVQQQAPQQHGTEKGLNIVLHECAFLQHCKNNVASLSEHDWYAMITNLAGFEGGTDAIHALSSAYPKYSPDETQKKINHFLDSKTRPMTCQTIAQKGFQCPKLQNGECTCKAPAALCYQPVSVDGLTALIGELTVSGNDLSDLKAATNFIHEYLYNQEGAIAEGVIRYELAKKFKLKADIVRSLIGEYKKANRGYQNGLKGRKHKVENTLPLWYAPMENGSLRFMPGILAEHLSKEQLVCYAAEQHYCYEGGVYKEMSDMQAQKITRDKMIPSETKMAQITDAEKQWRLLVLKSIHELNANPYIINLKNGLYNVLDNTLTEHTPNYYSTVQLAVSYDPNATCPRFRQYLDEVLSPDQIPLIQEMMGYFLVPITRAQKCFVIVGEGGAGKSQFLLVLNDILLGKEKGPDLQDKLRTEADGIFLFALEGLKRLMNNHYRFSVTQANLDELQQYREDSDSVLSFIKDCCDTSDTTAAVGSTELYNAYKAYCEESGMKPYSHKKFIANVLNVCPGTQKGVDSLGKKRIISGLKLGEILT